MSLIAVFHPRPLDGARFPGFRTRKTGSPSASSSDVAGGVNETCDRCHSRRGQFSGNWRPGQPLTDTHLPAFMTGDLFEDDGQMKDEVFNTSSFQQSKMFAKGVVCTECHDPHSGKLRALKSEVCSECHDPQKLRRPRIRATRMARVLLTASPAICQLEPTWLSIPGTIIPSGFPGLTSPPGSARRTRARPATRIAMPPGPPWQSRNGADQR